MNVTEDRSIGVDWVRIAEGAAVTVLLVVLFTVAVGPSRVEAVVARANHALVLVTLAAAVLWLLAWGETLYLLLEIHWPDLDATRFRVAFLGGMGARGLVPGGSVSGPAVMAYVVATSTDAETEGGVAMAYLAEFIYWLASVLVLVVGFVGVLAYGSTTGEVYTVVLSVLGVLTVGALGVGLAVHRPPLVEWPVRRGAAAVRGTVGRRIPRVEAALSPEAVDERLDRFLGSFATLAERPREALPAFGAALLGWVANVFVLAAALAALEVQVPTYVVLFVVPVAGFARVVSLLPGGVGGVGPVMGSLLVLLAEVEVAAAGAAVLLYRLATFWFRLGIGGACLLGLGLVQVPVPERAEADAE
ncbi:hypothetical protein BRD00_15085 [Halobacteriales archaeon QS_8_69_26]|nr:MAG: hypothetical protein BRD00_15085 [Halobacteriales archaeon QS_8_69_26]